MNLVGREDIIAFFNNQAKIGLGGRCYLFEGKKGVGKRTFTEYLAFHKLTVDPADYVVYTPVGKSHTHPIETLKSIKEEAERRPQGSLLMIVIDEAEKMAANASQVLLKVLEEPPLSTVFILLSENKHKLLPTILSRSQIVPFKPLKKEDILKVFPACTEEMLQLCQGSIGRAKIYAEKGIPAFVEQTKALLAKGRVTSYFELQESLNPIAEQLEEDDNRQLFFSVFLNHFRERQLMDLSKPVPFEKVFKATKEAKFSLDRFTSGKQVLETLFLEVYD